MANAPDPKVEALRALHAAAVHAKPTLDHKDPKELKVREAIERLLTAIISLPRPR